MPVTVCAILCKRSFLLWLFRLANVPKRTVIHSIFMQVIAFLKRDINGTC